MGHKVFISYKYSDNQVLSLNNKYTRETTVRDYVTELQDSLQDHINKGEKDNEDLSSFKDSTIESKLRTKIYDSSITVVLISKGMKSFYLTEADQWIPWEISYSLRETTRNDKTSRTNAILAVVLPDMNGCYDYYLEEGTCTSCKCRTLKTDFLFKILRDNMFNIKTPEFGDCDDHSGNVTYLGEASYIKSVKWSSFILNVDKYISNAVLIRDEIDSYKITKLL